MSQSGLAGVTLGVLADQVGMSKSGLFAHFRSKEDVQIGLLQYMAQFATTHVVQPRMSADEGLPRLKALVHNWFGWAQRAGLPGGCPVAAGLFEFDDVEGAVRCSAFSPIEPPTPRMSHQSAADPSSWEQPAYCKATRPRPTGRLATSFPCSAQSPLKREWWLITTGSREAA